MKRVLGRLGWSLVVVWAVVSIAFLVNDVLPGDPARMATGPQARPADVARIRVQLGLDRPTSEQYLLFWRRLVHLGPRAIGDADPARAAHPSCTVLLPLGSRAVHVDLGESFQMRQPVVDVVATRLPRTLAVALAGMLVQLVLGVAGGVLAAWRRGSWLDRALVGASLLGVSTPTFLIALSLQYLLAHELRWLPLDGFGTTWVDHARCLVLPAMTLGIYGAAYYVRLVRDEMIGLLDRDWIRTARAKGVAEWRVVVQHALRNAMMTVVTAAGVDLGALAGGAIITETVFRWPGLGELSVKATLNRDGPIMLACVVVASIAVVASNLLVDLTYAWIDPRASTPRGRGTR